MVLQPSSPEPSRTPVSLVNASGTRNAAWDDFVVAAGQAMPAVVHIKATESEERALQRQRQERMQDPWGFFSDEFFFGFPGNRPRVQRRQGSGSGVIFSENGYIVTNNHVIDFADQVDVTLFDNRKYKGQLVGTDPKTDLAVLKIDAEDLPTLAFGDSDQAQVGEWVLAVGNPFDLTSTVTAGIISAKGRDIDIIKAQDAIEAFIQTDAAVNPGNSGGALVNVEGELIGINTAIASRTGYYTGYSFPIPGNMMRRIVEDIIDQGFSRRGKMGLSVVELDGELAQQLELPMTQGLIIEQVESGGSAEMAGLQPFDVIIEANDKAVRSFPELQEQAELVRPGDRIHLEVYREGAFLRIPVVMR